MGMEELSDWLKVWNPDWNPADGPITVRWFLEELYERFITRAEMLKIVTVRGDRTRNDRSDNVRDDQLIFRIHIFTARTPDPVMSRSCSPDLINIWNGWRCRRSVSGKFSRTAGRFNFWTHGPSEFLSQKFLTSIGGHKLETKNYLGWKWWAFEGWISRGRSTGQNNRSSPLTLWWHYLIGWF